MATASDDVDPTAIGTDWILLERVGRHGKQGDLAREINFDPGDFSDFLNGKASMKLPKFRALMKALNLKLVDADARCVRPATFTELTRIAARALQEQPQLIWEDE